MNILNRKYYLSIAQKLTFSPVYQVYIHYQDHDKKINPKQNKLNLSYMDPKGLTNASPTNQYYIAKLRRSAQQQMQKRLFESYKQKILQGKIDQEKVVEPDTLWGQNQKPVHYYKNLSNTQISHVSHSILKDVQPYQIQIVKQYLSSGKKITEISQVKDINDYAELAAYFRLNNILQREKYFEIEQKIGNKFHLLTNRSLILLKYAFVTSPKKCTPQFNKIINDLLLQSLPKLTANQLVHLMFFNRHDHFRFHNGNLQIPVLEKLTTFLKDFTLQQKIDFLFLYVESRRPTIRSQTHNRHINQIRNRTQQIIHYLDLSQDLSSLSQLSVLKLAYSLVRARTNVTEHITSSIVDYVQRNIEKISTNSLTLFFIYFSKIQSNKSIENVQLMKQLKQKVISSWGQHSSINKLRALDCMYTLNLFDETAQKLYTQTPIQTDSSLLACFCRLEMMNSTGRQWEVIHKIVELDYIPLPYFQDYKRFYNYVTVTAPDWDLSFFKQKLENTQIFYDSLRFQNESMDKNFYKQLKQFQKFSELSCLPKPFSMGISIKNVEFAQFALPSYRISIDVINDVQKIRGTQEIKGSYQMKIKSLECLGWKHLYIFEQDVKNLAPLEFFDYLYSVCEPHFEQQLKLIASYDEYESYQIEVLRHIQNLKYLKMRQYEQYMNLSQKSKDKNEPVRVEFQQVLKKRAENADARKHKTQNKSILAIQQSMDKLTGASQ